MATKKKVKTQEDVELVFKLLREAAEACDHMDREMSPNARISWRERANTKVFVARGMIELLRLMKGR